MNGDDRFDKSQSKNKLKGWLRLKKELVAKGSVFNYFRHACRSLDSGKEAFFDVISSENWVNIIAIDNNQRVILVEQFRHGIEKVTLEIPGGGIDPKEEPLDGAKRELLEESGFEASDWTLLGFVYPNPAIMNNKCYFYLAQNLKQRGNQCLDEHEELQFHLEHIEQVKELIKSAKITHSLVIAAFYYYDLFKEKHSLE